MGIFKNRGDRDADRIDELEEEVSKLQQLLSPEVREAIIEQNTVDALKEEIEELEARKEELETSIIAREDRVQILDDLKLAQDTDMYSPRFDFATEAEFEEKLEDCRKRQAKAVKEFDRKAQRTKIRSVMNESEGHRLVNGVSRLLMRVFNMECDDIVRNVDTSNVQESMERVRVAADSIDDLGDTIGITLPRYYLELKFEEIQLSYEYKKLKGEAGEPVEPTEADTGHLEDSAAQDGGEVPEDDGSHPGEAVADED